MFFLYLLCFGARLRSPAPPHTHSFNWLRPVKSSRSQPQSLAETCAVTTKVHGESSQGHDVNNTTPSHRTQKTRRNWSPTMPTTPSKRRKKTETTPHNGKTLDFFFKSKANEAPQSPSRKSDSTAELPNSQALTDEEIARKLAKQWAEEDQAVENVGEAKHGEKRPRSSSEESLKVQDAADKPNASTNPPTNLERERKETAADLQNPSDGAVSLEAEDETRKMIDTILFDSDPLKFNPNDYYHLQETWPNGKATYALLVRAFVLVNSTRSRIKIVDTLVNFLRALICLDPDSLLPAVKLHQRNCDQRLISSRYGWPRTTLARRMRITSLESEARSLPNPLLEPAA